MPNELNRVKLINRLGLWVLGLSVTFILIHFLLVIYSVEQADLWPIIQITPHFNLLKYALFSLLLGLSFLILALCYFGFKASQNINKMRQQTQALMNARTKMLTAISHDLRTPLTRLKLRGQFIEDKNEAAKIIADLDEMETMIIAILSFAKNDNLREVKQRIDLNALLASICYDYADLGYQVEFKGIEHALPFLGRSSALKKAFDNIIGNAIKYAPQVWVSLALNRQKIQVCIEDNGPGIPKVELKKVFEAYYRSEHGKATTSTGSGLGLTVAHEIIQDHGGTISLQNKITRGLAVHIELPI